MAYQGINTGTSPNSGTGDTLLSGAEKINSNFIELFTVVGLGSTGITGVVTSITGGNNIGVSTSTGAVTVSAVGVITSIVGGTDILVTTESGISTISLSNTANVRADTLVVSGVSTLTNLGVSGLSTFTNVVVSGISTFKDNVVLGTSSANRVILNGLVDSPLVPGINQVYNLGGPADKWNNVYASVGNFIDVDCNKISAASSITVSNGFYGDGSGLTNLPGGITTSNVSANTLVVAGVSTLGAVNATSFSGDGTNITLLNASNLSFGTVPNDRFPAVLPAVSGANLTNLPESSNISLNTLVVSGVSTLGVVTGATYYGNGSNLVGVVTTLNGANASDVVGITTLISAGNNISVTTNSGISTISYTGIANTANINADSINVSGLSTFTGNVSCGQSILLGNTGKILIGTTPDLQVYHDGDNSYIAETGTGALRIDSSFTELRNATGTARAATFSLGTGASGGAQLYFNGTKKFQTTSTGSLVTGITTSTEGFSSGTGSPVKISVVGSTLTFTVDGIGSTSLTLS